MISTYQNAVLGVKPSICKQPVLQVFNCHLTVIITTTTVTNATITTIPNTITTHLEQTLTALLPPVSLLVLSPKAPHSGAYRTSAWCFCQWDWTVCLWSGCHGVLHVQVTGLAKSLSLWRHEYF